MFTECTYVHRNLLCLLHIHSIKMLALMHFCTAERPKKLRKLAGKLNVKKDLDYKAEQERRIEEPAYQPLLPTQVNGE